ncbi:hypothetical protein [Streptomyces sp. NPDC059378]|uniref:hypothetical protein n=1 Tax=Streptomyces sp. NPDC059378 TaxID=3346815 RepID=UPI003698323A
MRAREPMAVVLLACHRDAAADRLTVVAVAADEVEAAERRARAALAGRAVPADWSALPSAARRRVVRACRVIPAIGMHGIVDDERPRELRGDFLGRALRDAVEQFLEPGLGDARRQVILGPGGAVLGEAVVRDPWFTSGLSHTADSSGFEGLRALTEWTAACWSAPDVNDQPEDEDLLDIYDRYSVGGLPSGGSLFL